MALTERLALIIDAKTGGAVSEIKRVDKSLDDLGDSAKDSGSKFDAFAGKLGVSAGALKAGIGAAAVAAIPALIAFGKVSVEAASNLNEQLSQSSVIFGDAAAGVVAFGDAASSSIGQSQRAALEAANDFGLLFTNIGKSQAEAATMSTTLAALASDLASFKNTSPEEAVLALGSALRGESEPLTRYGVFLNDATLKQRALTLGIADGVSTLTASQKAQSAYAEILAQTTLAQGDFERTSGGLANSQRTLTANFEDLQASIGQGLLPLMIDLTAAANDAAIGFDRIDGPLITFARTAVNYTPNIVTLGRVVGSVGGNFDELGTDIKTYNIVGLAAATRTAELNSQFRAIIGPTFDVADATRRAASAYGTLANAIDLAQNRRLQIDFSGGEFSRVAREAREGVGDAIGEGIGAGIGIGLDNSLGAGGSGRAAIESTIDDVGNYLRAIARQQVDDLDDIFASIGSSISLDRVAGGITQARKEVEDLRARLGTLGGEIANQDAEIGRLLAESIAVTPEEQVAIERAEKELARVQAAYEGFIETTTNPSSFAGDSTAARRSGPSATLAELQVAEQRLAEARRASTGPTNELIDAQRKLATLREEQLGLAGQIDDAERSLVEAEQALVDAKLRQIQAGRELANQGPEFIAQYRAIATAAGLAADEINRLVAGIGASAIAAGLEDVFGNGQLFRTPEEAQTIRNFIRAQNGEPPGFADGGIVGGPRGAPQLALVHGGETILPTHKGGGFAGPVTINVSGAGDPSAVAIAVRNEFLKLQRRNGNAGFN